MITKPTPEPNTSSRPIMRSLTRRLFWIVGLLAALYFVPLILLIVFENSLVYAGSRYPQGNWEPDYFRFTERTYKAADGTELVGWYLPRRTDKQAPYPKEAVLLFHGNAENVAQAASRMGIQLQQYLNADVFVMDYRGYGKSKGVTTYDGVLMDAEAALQQLCELTRRQPNQIILFGHSLGGGPACYLASKHDVKGVFLDRTFASLPETAQQQYPMFPVQWLMQNRFPSREWMSVYEGPVFISHGKKDSLISWEQGQSLYDAIPSSKKKFHLIEKWGHWAPFPEDYWKTLAEFYHQHMDDGLPAEEWTESEIRHGQWEKKNTTN